jgi:hypothetical protein
LPAKNLQPPSAASGDASLSAQGDGKNTSEAAEASAEAVYQILYPALPEKIFENFSPNPPKTACTARILPYI